VGRLTLSALAIAIIIVFAVLNLAAALSTRAWSHDATHTMAATPSHEPPQGEQIGQFLYGKPTKASGRAEPRINCCTLNTPENGFGDCHEIHPSRVENHGDAGISFDGELIPRDELNASPNGRMYICKSKGKPAHCGFFSEAKG
jgi:hypothetical protein